MAQSGLEDQDTGLGNPRQLEAAFAQAVARAQRRKETFSLVLLEGGDALLRDRPLAPDTGRAVAARLSSLIGAEDTLARLDNQVFAVLLAGVGQREALTFGEEARTALSREVLPGKEGQVSLAARSGAVEWREGRGGLGETLEDAQWDLERSRRGVEGG